MAYDVIVIGAGAIGLTVARDLAADHSVVVLERGHPGRESSWAAAGMLCPHGESARDDALFRFGLASLGRYRDFVGGLREETGVDVEYQSEGTLVLAASDEEWTELERRSLWHRTAGLETTLVGPEEVRSREPRITLDIRGALDCRSDHQVHPRRLLEALRKACVIRGVEIVHGARAEGVLESNGQVCGVQCHAGPYHADRVIVATGAWTGQLEGLVPGIPTRPRKGQILSLEMPPSAFRHVVRWREFYLAPRRHGRLVVGATNEDSGFDRALTAAGVGRLLEAAGRLSTDTGAYPVAELWTGLRPATSDGWPAVGEAGIGGLFYAAGHYRNGILLAPETARIVGDAVRGRVADDLARAFSPMRFNGPESTSPVAVPESQSSRLGADV